MKKLITRCTAFPLLANHMNASPKPHSFLQIYSYSRDDGLLSYLVLSGGPMGDIFDYLPDHAPEIYTALWSRLEEGDVYLDLERGSAFGPDGPDDRPETRAIMEALSTSLVFPRRRVNLSAAEGLVSVILCGGKGSRMRSNEIHKVCFPIAGRPAVNRLIDQIERTGVREHVVVVGEKGRQVVREIAEIRDNVAFVYQINQNGTGNITQ